MNNLGLVYDDTCKISADSTESVQDTAILKLAHATVDLSRIAPLLSDLAAERDSGAEREAQNVHKIANSVREMSTVMEQIVQQLNESTNEISQLTEIIQRIANETRMIAINSGIAAAHAGKHGQVFSLLAKEIRLLSENTAKATVDVKEKIKRLQETTLCTSKTIGMRGNEDIVNNEENNQGFSWLLERINEVDDSATRQVAEARQLNSLGSDLRNLSEDMIRAVGSFRLDVHDQVENILENYRYNDDLISGDPVYRISVLRQLVKTFPFIELAYITNTIGIQLTDNVFRSEKCASYGDSGKGKNWSQRPWFIGAMTRQDIYLSEIYRSQATDEFCLTASARMIKDNIVIGVIAIDVNFNEILNDN